ncbi:MAG: glutamate--tRNA ligase, partial [Parcubacteria group bacterium]
LLEENLKKFTADSGRSVGEVFWPLRVALSGLKASPGPQEILWVLGKKKSLERLEQVLKNL